MIRKLVKTLGTLFLLFVATSAHALVILDFEGIAPATDQSLEQNTTRSMLGFDVFVSHGHYVDANQPRILSGERPDNGSDWLLHDYFDQSGVVPVTVTTTSGLPFSFHSIDASEWENTFPLGQTLTLTGHFLGGAPPIVVNLTTDNVFGFETFHVTGFDNIVQLDIIGSSLGGAPGSCAPFAVCGSLGYDNLALSQIPEPSTFALMSFGLLAVVLSRRKS